MFIKNIKLKDFRNYESLDMNLVNAVNIIYGKNAQGKTNLLEALMISATTRSPRLSSDKEIIAFDKDEAHIKVKLMKNDRENIIDVHLKKNASKGLAVNCIKIKRLSQVLGEVYMVMFSPDDIKLVKAGPDVRRSFLNLYICEIDKIYLYNLKNYNKVLIERNKLLKDIKNDKSHIKTLDVWDENLIKYGIEIIKSRLKYIEILSDDIKRNHFHISGEKEIIKTLYDKSVDIESFEKTLKDARDEDIRYSTTTKGPHRDDIKFYINDMEIKKYGSEGQKKSLALSIKLSELQNLKKVKNDNPILLLDDVFGTLDEERQKYLVENLKGIQSIITCATRDEKLLKLLNADNIIEIRKGKMFIT